MKFSWAPSRCSLSSSVDKWSRVGRRYNKAIVAISLVGILILLVQNIDRPYSRKLQSVMNVSPLSNFNPNLFTPQSTFNVQPHVQYSTPNVLIPQGSVQMQSPYMYPLNPNANPNLLPPINNAFMQPMQPVNPYMYQRYAPNSNLSPNTGRIPPALPYPVYLNPNNGDMDPTTLPLLPLPYIRDITEPFAESDIPYYWHIPKVGGSTLKNIISSCYDLKRPNRSPLREEASMEVFEDKFVNVDTATTEGIAEAKELGLIPSKITDVIISPRIYEIQALFNEFQRPRMFTMIRHPFSRLFSFFNYHKHASWEKKHSSFEFMENMTFQEYLRTKTVENNWLTCTLTNTNKREINETHVQLATDILARKCLIGITEEFNVSVHRFQQYFNWKMEDSKKGCLKRFIFDSPVNQLSSVVSDHQITKLEEGDDAWNLLLETNKYDLQLYENAVKIFQDQAKYFPNLA